MTELTTIATISLPIDLMGHVKDIASHKNIDYQDLLIGYIEEGVRQELHKVKWCDFITHAKESLQKHNVPPEAIDEIVNKFTY